MKTGRRAPREAGSALGWISPPLYRLKKGTVRPLDHRDAAALAERFDLKDGD